MPPYTRLPWLAPVVLCLACETVTAQGDPSVVGQWSEVKNLPTTGSTVAMNTHLLPDGRVMFYGRVSTPTFWDPATETVTTGTPASYDLFCSGHAFMADGRLLVSGGHTGTDGVGLPYASTYDASTDTWTRLPDMNAGRWYPTSTVLANGDVLVTSGSVNNTVGSNPLPQVWQAATNTWRDLTSAQLAQPLYPGMFLAPNGKVFYALPNGATRYLDTTGTGAWTFLANTRYGERGGYVASAAMYDDGKVLIVGGGDPPTATAEVIDLSAPAPAWRSVEPMASPRRHLNLTLLPDGTVLATGGTRSGGWNDAANPALAAEVWNPATERWTTLASMQVPRLYHSTALLLPDGRVLSAGGGEPAPANGADNYNYEIYSPPYLFKGARPTIQSAPSSVRYGQTFFVGTGEAAGITRVTWVRLSSVTHSFNQNQRINRLSFAQASGGLNVTAPSDPNLCPPGHYMLFVFNGQGVPSVAKIVRIEAATPPSETAPAAPSNLTATAVSSSQINLSWADNSGNETGFKIERKTGAGGTWSQITTTGADATSYSSTGLAASTLYYYRVRAYNGAGDSSYCPEASATTNAAPTPPAAPSNLTATAVSSSQINLTWADNSGNETGFKIERSENNANHFTQLTTASANATSFSDTGLRRNKRYYYRVRAYNADGNSAYSNTADARTSH